VSSILQLSTREEDYLKAIYILFETKGYVKVKDLARMMKVKAPSVVDALQKLATKGLIVYKKHEVILLTSLGREMARRVIHRHSILSRFLKELLLIENEIAEEDACYMEHGLHRETTERIKAFIEFLNECPILYKMLSYAFRYFLETGKYPSICYKNLEVLEGA